MAVSLVILTDPRDAGARRELSLPPGTTILRAAHAASIDITATCGGRGRCTSCRVKFLAGAIPPPTIMDEVQLGPELVREGYRLSCQCAPSEPVTVQLAPPIEEDSLQILGAAAPGARLARVTIDSGVVKRRVTVTLPREEHRQTSDLEALAAAAGLDARTVPLSVLATLPQALREE